jgi:glutamine transport system substrate-binding protein
MTRCRQPSRRFLLLTALTLAGCRAAQPADVPLWVASDLDNPPFAEVGADGEPRGRDVEMIVELARRLGRPVQWRRLPFEALLPAVERGEVDLVCATLGITPERQGRVRFTKPYFETDLRVVVRAGPGEPRSLAELAGRRVGAGSGTTSERALLRALPESIALVGGSKDKTIAERLASGELDGYVLDGPNAAALVSASTGRLESLEPALESERYALALPLSASRLTAELDQHLADMRREGFLLLLDARYGLVASTPR